MIRDLLTFGVGLFLVLLLIGSVPKILDRISPGDCPAVEVRP